MNHRVPWDVSLNRWGTCTPHAYNLWLVMHCYVLPLLTLIYEAQTNEKNMDIDHANGSKSIVGM